ncbi:MAG: polysaccharide deacetylase family protein [Thermoleophilia bacterium]|nr:polysaccharide deacetylase family protein [Thermoleophilia bacterium]
MPVSLCYHAISDRLDSPLAVTPARLREHMRVIASAGFDVITESELERRRQSGENCSRLASVSFDDGYVSTLVARDVLAEFGFTGTAYILPTMIGSREPMRWRGIEQWADGPDRDELLPLDWDQVEQLKASGWEIGSHTLTHPDLTALDDAALRRELRGAREQIVERLGRCDSIAYPYGLADHRVAAAAKAAGFTNGTTLPGWIHYNEPLLRPRLGIYRNDAPWRYRVKISPLLTTLRSLPLRFAKRSS